MAVYLIASMDITDPAAYERYRAQVPATIEHYGGRFLVRGGEFQNPEGTSRSRNVVIEFPTYQAALDCWNSPEYKSALAIRAPISEGDVVIIGGYEGAQP